MVRGTSGAQRWWAPCYNRFVLVPLATYNQTRKYNFRIADMEFRRHVGGKGPANPAPGVM